MFAVPITPRMWFPFGSMASFSLSNAAKTVSSRGEKCSLPAASNSAMALLPSHPLIPSSTYSYSSLKVKLWKSCNT